VKVKSKDEHGALSGFSSALTVTISEENNPPNKPSKPSGPTSGKPGTEYTYSTSTTDSDGDQISYLFSWGDGSDSGWTDSAGSGQLVSETNSWSSEGDYEIKVKARDIPSFEESDWSDPLSISMPKNKNINEFNPWIFRLIQRFPILEFLL